MLLLSSNISLELKLNHPNANANEQINRFEDWYVRQYEQNSYVTRLRCQRLLRGRYSSIILIAVFMFELYR